MNYLKVLYLASLLIIASNSYADSEALVSVKDVIDRGEDAYVSISKRIKSFLCGQGDQEMETSGGRFVKLLLCGKKNEGIDTNISRAKERLENNTALPEPTPELPDFDFVTIEPESFTMSSRQREQSRYSNENQVRVTITKPFEIMTTEVTQLQWFIIMKSNPSYFKKRKYCEDDYTVIATQKEEVSLCPNHPVEWISWNRVQAFIKELNRRENLTGCDGTPKSSSGCYRLPTEAEWEFATRAGSETAYYFGNNPDELTDHAWFRANSNHQTHAVGRKKSNDNGLYDVHGNVWEWVQNSYTKNPLGGIDPLHTRSGSHRILRGGSWFNNALHLHSANRNFGLPSIRYDDVGFRFLRTP